MCRARSVYSQKVDFQFADFCEEDLGLESGELGDEALTASSSYDPANVGPKNARFEENENASKNKNDHEKEMQQLMRKIYNLTKMAEV